MSSTKERSFIMQTTTTYSWRKPTIIMIDEFHTTNKDEINATKFESNNCRALQNINKQLVEQVPK